SLPPALPRLSQKWGGLGITFLFVVGDGSCGCGLGPHRHLPSLSHKRLVIPNEVRNLIKGN
ncbi:MAG: hypothetical protein V1904_07075, partial [Bacteroidota bacterium]